MICWLTKPSFLFLSGKRLRPQQINKRGGAVSAAAPTLIKPTDAN